jgi:poly-gamma-glutamate synthesis protein (capsule biosynthesis protein)
VRPAEYYKKGVIAYSLGNFVSDMIWYEPLRRGAVLRVEVDGAVTREASVTRTVVDSGYRVALEGRAEPAIRSDELSPLAQAEYSTAIELTVREQRFAVYRYVLWRLWRFPPKTLVQLLARTLRNKITAMFPTVKQR